MGSQLIEIVTDGSAIGNPGPGGWAAVFICMGRRWVLTGACPRTTATDMEVTAALEALKTLPYGSNVRIGSDSEYLVRGMRYQARLWKSQGWRNSKGVVLQNAHLWRELLGLSVHHRVRWRWIPGHRGHPIQELSDSLAYAEAKRMWETSRQAA